MKKREEPQLPVASNLPPALSRSPRWPPRYSSPLMLPRAISLFLSLSLFHACIHTLSPCHTHSLFLSFSYMRHTHSPVAERARACKVSRMRATRTRARPPLSQKHPLRFTLCTKALLPPSPRPSPPPPPSPLAAPPAVLAVVVLIVSSPIVSQKKPREKTANVMRTMDSFPPSLLCEDPFSGWRWDHLFRRYRSHKLLEYRKWRRAFLLSPWRQRINHSNLLRSR